MEKTCEEKLKVIEERVKVLEKVVYELEKRKSSGIHPNDGGWND